MSETKEFRKSYVRLSKDLVNLRAVELPIWRYLGQDEDPMWTDIDPSEFVTWMLNEEEAHGQLRQILRALHSPCRYVSDRPDSEAADGLTRSVLLP